jgi:hypothetical protein
MLNVRSSRALAHPGIIIIGDLSRVKQNVTP